MARRVSVGDEPRCYDCTCDDRMSMCMTKHWDHDGQLCAHVCCFDVKVTA